MFDEEVWMVSRYYQPCLFVFAEGYYCNIMKVEVEREDRCE